jgi:hypothetical protein
MPNFDEIGKTVEEVYREHIRSMSGKERLAKAFRFWGEIKLMIELQVKQKNPTLEGEALRFAVAERIYAAHPKTLALLRRMKP